MESFWGTLKNELVHHRQYATRQEAIGAITEYIEVFYNRQRKQAKLGYLLRIPGETDRCSGAMPTSIPAGSRPLCRSNPTGRL